MNNLQKDVITLIKSAITGEKYNLSGDQNIAEIFKVSKRHNIVPIVYYGALNCGVEQSSAEMQKMFAETCSLMAYNEKQMWEISNLVNEFEKENIAYIPLKGTLLKGVYPKGEMRAMGDADILIKFEEYEKIVPIMERLGYTFGHEFYHELAWDKGNIHIELHKGLVPEANKDYYSYYGDGWQLAKLGENSKYYMSNEDHFIFNFTHFSKHYRSTGVGIKHVVDLWVYKNHFKSLNEEYILTELKKLKLDVFYKYTMQTVAVWFDDAEPTEQTSLITKVIFNSGVFGTHETRVLADAVKSTKNVGTAKKAKFKKVMDIIFLPYEPMTEKYPFLKKVPVLLPVMWCHRWLVTLFFKRDAIKSNSNDIKLMSAKNVDDYQASLNFVGLDFNYKE